MTTAHLSATAHDSVHIYHAPNPTGPFPEQPPSAPLTPMATDEEPGHWIERQFTDPRALWKNLRLGGHCAVFGVAVFLFRQFGWWLKTV